MAAGLHWHLIDGRRLLAFALAAVLLLVGTGSALAQDEREPVRIDGRTVLRVGASGEDDAAARAQRIEQRLNSLLENPDAVAFSVIEASGENERIITVSGVPIVTITETDAQDNLTTVGALAVQWSQAIDAALRAGQERRQTAGWQVGILIEGAVARLWESITTVLPRLLAAGLILVFFGLLAALVRRLLRVLFRLFLSDLTLENLIRQIAYYTIWLIGLIIALNALGFDPQTVATGIGLTSLALGFALQDILSNFVSGLLILVLRPFKLGDQIVVGDTEGNVERIDLRATQIRTYDGRVVLVPNAELFTSRITNNTASPIRQATVEIAVGHHLDLTRALAVIQQATQSTRNVLDEPGVSLRIRDLSPQAVTVDVRFWTDSRRSDFLATMSNVRQSIVEALKQADLPLTAPVPRMIVQQDQAPKTE